jgi:hypothetical protein
MHITSSPQQAGWLGGKRVDLHPWGQASIFMNAMGCGQCWNVDQIFPTYKSNIL